MSFRTPIEKLRSLLTYNPETGIFTWLPRKRKGKIRGGEVAGTVTFQGYRAINIDCRPQLSHRIAWAMMTGEWPKHQIDHINMDRLDNRWLNLREATNSENGMNRKAQSNNKSSGVKGVTARKHYGYMANITKGGKTIYLGFYKTIPEAKAAWEAAAKVIHKDFKRS